MLAGDLPAWRGRRIAEETMLLSAEAAGFVDARVGFCAHRVSMAQLQRLVEEAIARFMPEHAEKRRRDAADRRHFDIDTDQVSFDGTVRVDAELDLADGLDLEDAIRAGAARLKNLGSELPLDIRRSLAAGELVRHQNTLDLDTADTGEEDQQRSDPTPEPGTRPGRSQASRQVVLYVHLSEAALGGTGRVCGEGVVARVENTHSLVTAEQVRAWCANPGAQITVKPVLDLAEHIRVDAYEVPDRLAEQVALRDQTCAFPWCTRPARACHPDAHPCDTDHVLEHARGGPTCSCNLAPLCRRHHRLKTHTTWTYIVLEPGTYLWSSPHGYQFLRDHHGTLDVSHDRPRPPGPAADPPEQ